MQYSQYREWKSRSFLKVFGQKLASREEEQEGIFVDLDLKTTSSSNGRNGGSNGWVATFLRLMMARSERGQRIAWRQAKSMLTMQRGAPRRARIDA